MCYLHKKRALADITLAATASARHNFDSFYAVFLSVFTVKHHLSCFFLIWLTARTTCSARADQRTEWSFTYAFHLTIQNLEKKILNIQLQKIHIFSQLKNSQHLSALQFSS